ncbi:fibroblast growth factor receptor substrate 2 [Camelus ferus]|nr:fibroblast growth factor receptor substrate 2 [Camelus ferus]
MGSCCSCPDKDTVPDNHRNKFKVINVDDDGNELGSGIMELTDTELILYTRKRDSVKWHYLCLRRYGYDSNLFSFESGRRCQTGQGIFAFKCARAEELFNMLQEIMQNNSINVVEEPVVERNNHQTELEVPRTPRTPTSIEGNLAYSQFVGSQVHTYVNTTGVQEERKNRTSVHVPLEARISSAESNTPKEEPSSIEDRDPQILLEPEGVKFVLGPTPVQKQLMEKEKLEQLGRDQVSGSGANNTEWDTGYDSDERRDAPSVNKLVYENLNGLSVPSASGLRRGRLPSTSTSETQNINNSAQRRTALLNYENLPSLPPVWEARKLSRDEDDNLGPKTPSLNGYHNNLDPMHNYVNTENVTVPASAHKIDYSRRRDCTPTVFNFDIRRPSLEHRQLNYIQVDLEGGSDSDNPQTPKTPTTPLPQTPTRRTELYAVIDIERTAAMSSLQKALPRDDGTSRKTRHNSTDLPIYLLASLSLAPVNIFKAGADEERAETARLSSFIGAIAIGDLVKSTLGPKGMDKILLSSGRDASLMVTNDGATILKNIGVDNPAAKVLVGFLLDKKIGVNQPKRIENAKILIANTGMDTDKIKIFGSRVRVDSTAKVAEIEHAEKEKMKEKVERILKHGINCFINRQLIYNYPEQLFGAAGVMAIEHADFAGVERLALVTGGEIASTFDHPELVKLGSCKLIEEVMIGEDKLIHFSGVALGEACTIVLRGATQQILDEAERSLHDALCVLAQTVKDPRTVYGGGCSEMLMAHAVTQLANRTPGKEAVAMESYAKALRMLPTIIADNAGYDSADLVAQLRAAHSEGNTTAGLGNVSLITTPVKHSHMLLSSGSVRSKVVFERLRAPERRL